MTQTDGLFEPFLLFEIKPEGEANSTHRPTPSSNTHNSHNTARHADTAARSPIPVTRLAVAKEAARQNYLNSMKDTASPKKGARNTFAASAPIAGRRAGPKEVGVDRPFHTREGTYLAPTKAAAPSEESDSMQLKGVMRRANDPKKILYAIFPPKVIPLAEDEGDHGGRAVVRVSSQQVSREEVTALHEAMVKRLEVRRAKPQGLCGIRREVYEDVFSEVIRQVTLEEPARGVLLQRLRDEYRQELLLHADLKRRADYFVSRKQNVEHTSEAELKKRISVLQAEKRELEAKRSALRTRQMEENKRYERDRLNRNKEQQEELQYLRRTNQQLSLRLKLETERASGASAEGIVKKKKRESEKIRAM